MQMGYSQCCLEISLNTGHEGSREGIKAHPGKSHPLLPVETAAVL